MVHVDSGNARTECRISAHFYPLIIAVFIGTGVIIDKIHGVHSPLDIEDEQVGFHGSRLHFGCDAGLD